MRGNVRRRLKTCRAGARGHSRKRPWGGWLQPLGLLEDFTRTPRESRKTPRKPRQSGSCEMRLRPTVRAAERWCQAPPSGVLQKIAVPFPPGYTASRCGFPEDTFNSWTDRGAGRCWRRYVCAETKRCSGLPVPLRTTPLGSVLFHRWVGARGPPDDDADAPLGRVLATAQEYSA